MAVEVMTWVWNCSKSKNAARLILLAIADSASSDDGRANLSIKGLQRKANLNSERTVQDAVKALVKLGELDVRYNEGLGGSNVYIVHWDPAESAGVLAERKAQLKARTPAKSAPPQNLRGGAKSAGGNSPKSSQVRGADPAESAPPQNLHPAKSADGPIGRKEGSPPTYLPDPPDRARDEARGREDTRPIAQHVAEFIASLDLDRSPDSDEEARIANLVAAKLDGGWGADELKRSIDGRWANVDSRIAVVVTRLKRLANAPQRRGPAAPAEPRGRCEFHALPLPCHGCAADAKAVDAPAPVGPLPEVVKSLPVEDIDGARDQAKNEGFTDPDAIELRAIEILDARYAQSAPHSPMTGSD